MNTVLHVETEAERRARAEALRAARFEAFCQRTVALTAQGHERGERLLRQRLQKMPQLTFDI